MVKIEEADKIKESIILMIKLNCYKRSDITKELGVKYQSFYSNITTCKNIEVLQELKNRVAAAINSLNKKRYRVDWKTEINNLYLNGTINNIEQLYFYKVVIDNFKQVDKHLVDLYKVFLKSGLEFNINNLKKVIKECKNDM